jgi:AraC-like DNA-binding protein
VAALPAKKPDPMVLVMASTSREYRIKQIDDGKSDAYGCRMGHRQDGRHDRDRYDNEYRCRADDNSRRVLERPVDANARSVGGRKATLLPGGANRLERLYEPGSCASPGRGDRVRIGSGAEGIERLEAHFHCRAFCPHRHDTYAIGMTLSGVQSFRFRGQQWQCLPGQCHILHPDETHDGAAGTDEGFGYRIVYIDPFVIQDALGGSPLPFVGCPLVDALRLPDGCASEMWDIDEDLDEVARVELVLAAANLLVDISSDGARKCGALALSRLCRVRDFIAACPTERRSMDELESLCGLDRWTLARQFRAAFGTSPSRFRTMRQLDHVRQSLKRGMSLAEASVEAGFADQSHMSRQFKKAYGLTPGAWVSAVV